MTVDGFQYAAEEGITAAFDVNIRRAAKEVYSARWSSCTKYASAVTESSMSHLMFQSQRPTETVAA